MHKLRSITVLCRPCSKKGSTKGHFILITTMYIVSNCIEFALQAATIQKETPHYRSPTSYDVSKYHIINDIE